MLATRESKNVTENYLLVKDAWKINGSAFMIDENFRLASNVGPRKSDVFASKTRKRVKDAEKSLLFASFHRNQASLKEHYAHKLPPHMFQL